MILSVAYRTTHSLLRALAVAMRHDASKDAMESDFDRYWTYPPSQEHQRVHQARYQLAA